jgi:hypothetical protein
VPLAGAALDAAVDAGVDAAAEDAAPVAGGVDVVDELDEHAAMASAAMTAPPAATACLLPRSCMWGFSLVTEAHERGDYRLIGRRSRSECQRLQY